MNWRILRGLSKVLILVAGVALIFASSLLAEIAPPAHLQCEHMENPMGIGATQPQFSWKLQDDRRGARQTAYQILVSGSLETLAKGIADVWDSGKVETDESVNVQYTGPQLRSRLRYHWQVRIWDQDEKASPYSQPNWWEMGLLSREDWKAEWISRDDSVARGDEESGAKWIWAVKELPKPTSTKHRFRFHFVLGDTPRDATLLITAKETVAAWVNGEKILEASPSEIWGRVRVSHVAKSLNKGGNILAAEAIVGQSDVAGAGLFAVLRLEMSDGKILRFISDANWKIAPGKIRTNWYAKNFDDSSWPNAAILPEDGQKLLGRPWLAQPASLLRKTFQVTKPVRSARIYSTALGTYQLYLNGQRIGSDILAPGWTDYSKRIVYQVHDITSQLKEGVNAVGGILGDGWYASGLTWLQTRYLFGPPPVCFLLQLEIEYADGSRDLVVTDGSWKTTESPILKSEIYDGETYDARKEQNGWDQPSFTDPGWEAVRVISAWKAPLVAQDFQPIRVEKFLKPKMVTNPAPGVFVFDLGQNMVGWARLRVSGPRGTKVTLRFGEVLKPSGEVYTANNRSAKATDTYVLSGVGQELFEPHFTFHGFRYIELTGYPGRPSPETVEGVVFHTDTPFTMQFSTANEIVNQLWSNILWGQRGNFLSVPTDCPQRDERLGWMGDAEVFWRTASYNQDLAAFSHKFAADMRDAQTALGAFTDFSPIAGSAEAGTPGWGDAGVIIPWTAYSQYKDRTILEEHWSAMEKWMDYIQGPNLNYLWLTNRGGDYGDWLAIGSKTPKDLIATAFWAYDASLMAQIAQALGRPADVQIYSHLYKNIREAFNKQFVKPDGTVGSGSQTCYVLALHMNLLLEKQRTAAVEKLIEDLKAHNWHLTTGFLGTPYLLPELSRNGHSDVAYRLLLNMTYPSWGYMVKHGATTMWERWDGNQMLHDPSMNSFNHYAYGAVGEWLYRYAAGIDEDPEDPGFHHILLHPQFSSAIGMVRGTYNSPFGLITSGWQFTPGSIAWDVTIPPNTRATIYLPAIFTGKLSEESKGLQMDTEVSLSRREDGQAVYEIVAGSYRFKLIDH